MSARGKAASSAATPGGPDPRETAAAWKDRPGPSGSGSGDLTLVLVNQACRALWVGREPDPRMVEVQQRAVLAAMRGVAPRDPLEGMLAAQMVATHEAAMECFRRAHLPEQGFEGRQAALGQANRLVRSYAALLEALDRHRGKGQPQVVRVERVTVEAGGRAIVGAVRHGRGGGDEGGSGERSHAKGGAGAAALAHAPEPALRGADPEREPVPVAGGAGEEALQDARRARRPA